MGCDRRTLLSALAGGSVLASTGISPSLASDSPRREADEYRATSELLQRAGEGVPATLEGTVSTAPVSSGDRLLLGTDRGLYVFTGGTLSAFIPTRPIRSITPFGDDRAVVLVEDIAFRNVLAIDLSAGEIDWSARKTRTVHSQEFGETERQVPAFDAVALEDVVVVAVGYGVVAFDRATGEQRWTVERDYYSWRLEAIGETVYAGTQDGKLLAIDGATGEERYAVQLADPFEYRETLIPRSVWAVEAAENGELLVTTEDGTVKSVAADDGSVRWETRVFEPDADDLESYYHRIDARPTMAGGPGREADGNFFNLDVTVIGGEPSRYAVSIREHERGDQKNPGRIVLVSPDGEIEWRNETVDLGGCGNILQDPRNDGLLVPEPPGNEVQPITVLDPSTGRKRDQLEIPAVSTAQRLLDSGGVGYLGAHDGELIVGSESGDLLAIADDGTVTWNVPRIRDSATLEADFTGDGTDDVLVYSRNQLGQRRDLETRALVVRSGTDGAIEWARSIGADQFRDEGGLQGLCPRERSDGSVDLVGIEQRPEGENAERIRSLEREIDGLERESERRDVDNSTAIERHLEEIESLGGRRIGELVVLSGRDGSERRRIELAIETDGVLDKRIEPRSVDVFGDDDRIAIVGGRNRVSLVDLAEGTLFWTRSYRQSELWPPIDTRFVKYVTIDGPGDVADIVAVAPEKAAVARIETDVRDGDLYFESTTTVELAGDEAQIVQGSVELVPDLDGDGYQELLCGLRREGGRTVVVVSPGDGTVLERFEGDRQPTPTVETTTNPAGDGPGLVTFTSTGDRFTVTVTDGIEERWRRQLKMAGRRPSGKDHRPAALAGDVDGDGQQEVAIATSAPAGGAKVDLYNVSQDERIETIVLETFDESVDPDEDPLAPAVRVKRLPDVTGDGAPKLGIVVDAGSTATTGRRTEENVRFYVVDPGDGTVLVSGSSNGGTFITLQDALGQLGQDASLRTVDPSVGVTLERSDDKPVTLSWQFGDDVDRITTVTVEDRPVAITTDRSTEVRLPSGTHTVELAATSPDGHTIYDSATVTVDANSSSGTLLYGAASVSVLGLLGVPIAERIRRVRS